MMTASSVAGSTGFVWNDLFSAHFDTTHSLLQEEEDGYEDISSDDELNDGEEAELVTVSVSNKSFLFVFTYFSSFWSLPASSLMRSSHNHHACYSAVSVCCPCVSMAPALRPSLVQKSLEGTLVMSAVLLKSGISGLSFDFSFLSPLLFSSLVLLLILSLFC